jgi:hypothetical protein
MGRVPLLPGRLPVILQDLVDDGQERFQLPLLSRSAQTIAGRLIVGEDLLEGVPAQAILLHGSALA